MLPGDLPLLQVGEITAAVEAYLLLRQVEFQDPVHGALEKRAVVADQDGPGPQASHEPFQDLQPGDVQVVGRSQPDPAGQKGNAPSAAACLPTTRMLGRWPSGPRCVERLVQAAVLQGARAGQLPGQGRSRDRGDLFLADTDGLQAFGGAD